MPTTYTLDIVREVWDDKTGEREVIRPDTDGCDLVQVGYISNEGKTEIGRVYTPTQAILIANAMRDLATELLQKERDGA